MVRLSQQTSNARQPRRSVMTMTSRPVSAAEPRTGTGHLTVGEVAAESGVAASAVRFYEKQGIIHARRTSTNQRRFDESAACRIHVAKLAQRVGLTVREIAELFDSLPADPEPDDWSGLADHLVRQAEQRVADLKKQLEALGSDAKLCDLGAELR